MVITWSIVADLIIYEPPQLPTIVEEVSYTLWPTFKESATSSGHWKRGTTAPQATAKNHLRPSRAAPTRPWEAVPELTGLANRPLFRISSKRLYPNTQP